MVNFGVGGVLSRIALYRKYRSADFDDVVGQSHVTKTLDAAVKKGLLSHAYLLTGPRGVGKTSIARILARRANDLPIDTDLSRELDIIEVDAASNRGIDEIRSLREKIASAPTHLRYKVYIIDEVHMLTREAFNALLKTLEEPPAHAIFILATTEAHKLPATIISRTQRFDLRPISQVNLVERLSDIAAKEKIIIYPEALEMIASSSRGGFRDAISLLDQLSVLGEDITAERMTLFLGIASTQDINKLIEAILTKDSVAAITHLEELIEAGNEPLNMTHQILNQLRTKLIEDMGKPSGQASKNHETEAVAWCIQCFTTALTNFKISGHYSLPLELAIAQAIAGPFVLNNDTQEVVTTHTSTPSQNSASTVTRQESSKATKPAYKNDNVVSNMDETNLCLKGLSLIKERNNSLYAVMRSANPHIEGDTLVLQCRFGFHKERIEEFKNRQLIEKVMTKTFGREIQLDCQLSHTEARDDEVNSDMELVSSALEILGGEVVNG